MIAAPVVLAAAAEAPKVEIWALDQVRIARDTDPAKVDALKDAHSLKDAVAILKGLDVPFIRTRGTMKPAVLPADIRATIEALPKGEPFVFPDGKFISINVIVSRDASAAPSGWHLPAAYLHSPSKA